MLDRLSSYVAPHPSPELSPDPRDDKPLDRPKPPSGREVTLLERPPPQIELPPMSEDAPHSEPEESETVCAGPQMPPERAPEDTLEATTPGARPTLMPSERAGVRPRGVSFMRGEPDGNRPSDGSPCAWGWWWEPGWPAHSTGACGRCHMLRHSAARRLRTGRQHATRACAETGWCTNEHASLLTVRRNERG